MIQKETIDKIVSQIQITEVIGEFVQLKKRGTNYLGLCPFHNEKSPSFTVSPNKEIYKCFGCGKSGNTISFLMEHEKINYTDAIRWLGKKYNVDIEETATDPAYKEQQQLSDSLFIINHFARDFFETRLWEHEDGQTIGYTYLKERGFSKETIKKFQLGYGPDAFTAFAQEATAKKYNHELLLKSGLVVERQGQLMDNYRDRIIFPIHNPIGKVIGFGARQIKTNEKSPKYINSPENDLYVKSKVLYGVHFAKQHIGRQDECLLVEGYTDVISLHQAGVENVVASGGTSLTPDQLRLIKKYTNQLTIVYDGDSAGIKAALRGLDLALEEGLQVQLVLIPDGEDPDSYVRKVGKDVFNQFIATNKKDFILFQLEVGLKDAGNDSRKRNEVVNHLAESISKINKADNFTQQQDYIRQTAEKLQIEEAGLVALVNKFITQRLQRQEKKWEQKVIPALPDTQITEETEASAAVINLLLGHEMQERAVLKVLLLFGDVMLDTDEQAATYIFRELAEFQFDNTILDKIYIVYHQWYAMGITPSDKTFLYHDDPEIAAMVVSLLATPHQISDGWDTKAESKKLDHDKIKKLDIIRSVQFYKLRKLKEMLVQNQQELKLATDPAIQNTLLELHMALKKIEKEITQQLGTVIMH